MVEKQETLKKLKKNGVNVNDLQSEDFKKLIEMNIKGQIENETIRDYLKESNVALKIFFDGVGAFVETHKFSSNKYIEALEVESHINEIENYDVVYLLKSKFTK